MEEKRPCFTWQKPFHEDVRPSFLPEGSLALNKGENFFFSKVPDFLFKMYNGLREKMTGLKNGLMSFLNRNCFSPHSPFSRRGELQLDKNIFRAKQSISCLRLRRKCPASLLISDWLLALKQAVLERQDPEPQLLMQVK